MIEPKSTDVGRDVVILPSRRKGRINGFTAIYVFVLDAELGEVPVKREELDWATAPAIDPREPTALARAALSCLEAAGLAIEVVDAKEWRVEGFVFFPEAGLWRRPDKTVGGGGAVPLIEAIRRAKAAPATDAA